jgi:hypothetical protein
MEYMKTEDYLELFHSDPRYIDLLKRIEGCVPVA